MSNPSGRDHDATEATEPVEQAATEEPAGDDEVTDSEPTDALSKPSQPRVDLAATQRRFTAPSNFDAGSTEIIHATPDPATEVFSAPTEPNAARATPSRGATPQSIPARPGRGRPPMRKYRSWGWVLALILVIAALAAVAIMGTVWLTHTAAPREPQEDMVRLRIQNFDVAVEKGDPPEANVTSFMADAPQTRSTRGFDLQYRDGQWKICQAPGS